MNNRQAGRRNRGRNNGRPNGGNRNGENGNRIDSRARGNAPQLLEKYRNLARDAQLAGDRVNTEYYLQFADHYFRVIADNRSRQEEQQARYRRNDEPFDDEGMDGQDEFGMMQPTVADMRDAREVRETRDDRNGAEAQDNRGYRDQREPRDNRDNRDNREARDNRDNRGNRDFGEQREARAPRERGYDNRRVRVDRPERNERDERQESPALAQQDAEPSVAPPVQQAEAVEEQAAPRRSPRGRKPRAAAAADTGDAPTLDLAVLPPSISRADNDSEPAPAPAAEEAPAPKRRGRPRKVTVEAAE